MKQTSFLRTAQHCVVHLTGTFTIYRYYTSVFIRITIPMFILTVL